jgi:chromosome segregation ATPase
MNYQEASIELEKLVKLFKALEHADSVISSLATAEAYQAELADKSSVLKTEVAELEAKKGEAQLALNNLFVTKSADVEKLVADAKEEVNQLKNKAKDSISAKLAKAEQEAATIVSKAYDEVESLNTQIKDLQVQRAAAQQELKDLEGKLQAVKSQIAKLLGN